jgi:thioredoxin reductase (NADPH)
MTGYQPPFEFMEACGIKFRGDEYHTPVYDEQTMESNSLIFILPVLYAVGLKTNKWFIENSRIHANLIIEAIRKRMLPGRREGIAL